MSRNSAIITRKKGSASALYAGESGIVSPKSLLGGIHRHGGVEGFRAASTLPPGIVDVYDDVLVRAGRRRLTLVSDMIAKQMTRPLPNWFGVPVLKYRMIGEAGHAQRAMVPKTRGERQIAEFEEASIPIFCTFDDFSFDARTLANAERVGYDMDTVHAEMANVNVNEAVEDQAWNGLTDEAGNQITIAGVGAPGFLTNPVNTFPYTGGEAWDAAGHTGEEIIADITAGITVLQADRKYGPYYLYVPPEYHLKMATTDFKAASDDSILARVLQMEMIEAVRPAEELAGTDTTMLIQMTSDVADVIIGQQPTLISWADQNQWEFFFVVLACAVVRLKTDPDSGSGYAIGDLT